MYVISNDPFQQNICTCCLNIKQHCNKNGDWQLSGIAPHSVFNMEHLRTGMILILHCEFALQLQQTSLTHQCTETLKTKLSKHCIYESDWSVYALEIKTHNYLYIIFVTILNF